MIGALLALGLTGSVVGTVRCMSATTATCSWNSLTGTAPVLDVPYAETRREAVNAMLDLAKVGEGDRVLDLGTGDGRMLLAAAERGARGVGIDIDPALVARATADAERRGLSDRVRFETRDLFAMPLGGHDVVTMFLLPEINLRLRPRLLTELRPGARVVSHAFTMGDWSPDGRARVGGSRLYLWIVPARAAGTWRTSDGRTLIITQRHQRISVAIDGRPVEARLAGNRMTLAGEAVRIERERMVAAGWTARRDQGISNSPAAPMPPAVHIDTTT
ncbi:SAM-dependent methyltransferase [Sphingomonas sp.]